MTDWRAFYNEEHRIYPPSEQKSVREEHLWRLVKSLMPSGRVDRLLDIGCGAGHISNQFLDLGVTAVTGLDLSSHRIEFAQSLYSRCKFEVGSINALPYDDATFDLVSALEVLEHVEDMDGAVGEMKRVAKRWLLLSVPFEQQIPIVLCPNCLKSFNFDGHLRSFREQDLVRLIERHALSVVKIGYDGGWEPAWKRLLQRYKIPSSVASALQRVLITLKLTEQPKPDWIGVLATK